MHAGRLVRVSPTYWLLVRQRGDLRTAERHHLPVPSWHFRIALFRRSTKNVRKTANTTAGFLLALLLAFQPFSLQASAFAKAKQASGVSSSSQAAEQKLLSRGQSARNLAINAESAILIDASSGAIMWQKDAFAPRAPASTTKMLTAILVLENSKLDEIATVSPNAAKTGGASMLLKAGERLTVEQLLQGLLLRSANDSAIALAEHVSGSVPRFVNLMNRKAKAIGAVNTHFVTPHGLDSPGHYSTAYDLALIARYTMKNPAFAAIVSRDSAVVPWPGHSKPRTLENQNGFLKQYTRATGVKTGHTKLAGYCLVASASVGQVRLISVVMGDRDKNASYRDSERLMDYGFGLFQNELVVHKGKSYGKLRLPLGSVNLVAGRTVSAVVRQSPRTLKKRLAITKAKPLTVDKGQRLGMIYVVQDGKRVGQAPLLAGTTLKPATAKQWLSFAWYSLINLFG